MGSPNRVATSRPRRRRWQISLFVTLGLLTLAFIERCTRLKPFDILATLYGAKDQVSDRRWQWHEIQPQKKLVWQSCYDGSYDCARLDVPMDWLDPSDVHRVVLAVIRIRATDMDDYRGPVFFNPGGPGGSGVFALKDRGKQLQTIIGKNHDVISWDPRGIGASIPRVHCWDSPEKSRIWALQDLGVIGSHPGVLNDAFIRATAFSQACEASMSNSSLLQNIGTPSHARDLLELVHQTGSEKLKYWGFSYGTLLGGTFASLYPDKVERLVSDGNVDYKEWYHQSHVNFLRDTDKVMEAFYVFCHSAGLSACALYEDTPAAIRTRLDKLLEDIHYQPVIVPASSDGPDMPQLITWSHVKRLISTTLYQPARLFKRFAQVLASLERRDGSLFYKMMQDLSSQLPICPIQGIPPNVPMLEESTDDAFPAIMCADQPLRTDTVEQFGEFAQYLQEISSAAGAVLALFRLACVGRSIKPRWNFNGPFEGNTSHPILYIANMADNVTPLVSARNNSQGFPGSVVLVQNSYGHTSLSASSTCTARYINSYFQNGTLPEPGASCEPDYPPFQDLKPNVEDDMSLATYQLSQAQWGFINHLKP